MDGTVTVNKALQRSRGEAGLGFRDGDLTRLQQRGAAKALLPRTHSNTHEAVLVNTADTCARLLFSQMVRICEMGLTGKIRSDIVEG